MFCSLRMNFAIEHIVVDWPTQGLYNLVCWLLGIIIIHYGNVYQSASIMAQLIQIG